MGDEALGQAAWPNDAWRLRLCLEVTWPRPPAIQYGIFTEEPIAKFKAVLGRMEKPWLAKLQGIDDEEKRQTVKEMQRAWAWNHLFRSLPGDEVYLLISGCKEIALMSNALAGKKWVVSKPVLIDDRRLCWSLPFTAVAGEEVEVSLRENTALYLSAIDDAHQT